MRVGFGAERWACVMHVSCAVSSCGGCTAVSVVVSSICVLCRLWVHAFAVFNIYTSYFGHGESGRFCRHRDPHDQLQGDLYLVTFLQHNTLLQYHYQVTKPGLVRDVLPDRASQGRAANICTTFRQSRLSRTSITHEPRTSRGTTESSTDWCMGRRPELKSAEFFVAPRQVIYFIALVRDCGRL